MSQIGIRRTLTAYRIVQVVILAMQKPNSIAETANLLPRLMLSWKIVIWVAPPRTKRTRNIEVIGSSRVLVGVPPGMAVLGGYGGR